MGRDRNFQILFKGKQDKDSKAGIPVCFRTFKKKFNLLFDSFNTILYNKD